MAPPILTTELCTVLGIKCPVLLAGMAHVSGARLAAAVSNAGGLGVVGGFQYTPSQLQEIITDLKANLANPSSPFGVDLAIPQVGGSARKTNYDYTHGKLDELIELIIRSGASLFVSAIGVPPPHIIKRLHDANILIMNMVGHPKHAHKALMAGVDLLCAQGTEGGGHTGETPTSILIPAVVDVAKQYKSPLTGRVPMVVAAGGIYDGRGLASSLMNGAAGVWVGTRFVASQEADCSQKHKEAVVSAGADDTIRTLVLSGRPVRVRINDYILDWEKRPAELKDLVDRGVVPITHDLDENKDVDPPHLMGQVAGLITDIKPAAAIIADMVKDAADMIERGHSFLNVSSKL